MGEAAAAGASPGASPGARAGFTVVDLLDEASTRSGLSDWGDRWFVPALALLVDSCRDTAAPTPDGWQVLRRVLVRHLRNRLAVQAHLTAHADVADRSLGAPVVVTGLPRTGTTLLHNLLSADPAHRPLRFWEALRPLPPEPDGSNSEEALVRQAEQWLERLYALTPSFRSIHAATARGPEECDALMQNAFASQHFEDMYRADAYSEWLGHATLDREYDYYALQLRVLTVPGDPRRWVLKSPSHLSYLDSLLRTLPDATVVQCHRSPEEAVGSYASLVLAVRRPHTADLSPAAAGAHALRRCTVASERALGVRQRMGDGPFFDVGYTELVADPLSVARRLYDHLGRPLGAAAEAAMRRWLADNPQHKHGAHRYELADFGLTADQITTALAPYLDRFEGQSRP